MNNVNNTLYESREAALVAGVPAEHINMVEVVKPHNGPFKGRTYVRVRGQLMRIDNYVGDK